MFKLSRAVMALAATAVETAVAAMAVGAAMAAATAPRAAATAGAVVSPRLLQSPRESRVSACVLASPVRERLLYPKSMTSLFAK